MPNRDITIAELPATTVAADNSYIPIDNGDITYKIKVSDYNAGANATAKAYAEAAGTSANSASASAGNASTYAANASQSAQDASNSANTALNHSNNASLYANNAYEYAAAASTSASNATSQAQQVSDYAREAGEKSEDAEAFAVGQRGGVDVNEEDEAYENNAKYYKDQASAEVARISDLTANVSSDALKAEGYAVGTQDGSPVISEYSQNNAKYYAEMAASSARTAQFSKNVAVENANRAENAVVKAPYIGDNNHWYVYNFDQEEYIDTNVGATGDPGTPGQKGDAGITPTITATASVDNTSGTPSVTVQKSGSNTNPSFAFSFRGLKGQPGDGSGTSYDDTEIREDIADIWKVQGEFGAKNLLVPEYFHRSQTVNGMTFTVNNDGSITLDGTATAMSYFILRKQDFDEIAFASNASNNAKYVASLKNGGSNIILGYNPNTKNISIGVTANTVCDNLTVYPMIRHAEDTDDTWQPYTPTNRQLYDNANTQLPIIGEYLPTTANGTTKKYSAQIGATTATFNASRFMSAYNLTSSDLNLDVSAETQSGNVIAYNSVTINSSGVVTITFDELTEAATFVCKASKIN